MNETVKPIEGVLQADVLGRIGCHVDSRTYIVPITYANDGEYIYGHGAARTKTQMRRAVGGPRCPTAGSGGLVADA